MAKEFKLGAHSDKNFFTADGRPRGSESVVVVGEVVGEEVGALEMVRVISTEKVYGLSKNSH